MLLCTTDQSLEQVRWGVTSYSITRKKDLTRATGHTYHAPTWTGESDTYVFEARADRQHVEVAIPEEVTVCENKLEESKGCEESEAGDSCQRGAQEGNIVQSARHPPLKEPHVHRHGEISCWDWW